MQPLKTLCNIFRPVPPTRAQIAAQIVHEHQAYLLRILSWMRTNSFEYLPDIMAMDLWHPAQLAPDMRHFLHWFTAVPSHQLDAIIPLLPDEYLQEEKQQSYLPTIHHWGNLAAIATLRPRLVKPLCDFFCVKEALERQNYQWLYQVSRLSDDTFTEVQEQLLRENTFHEIMAILDFGRRQVEFLDKKPATLPAPLSVTLPEIRTYAVPAAVPCTHPEGYNAWHLAAMQLLTPRDVEAMIVKAQSKTDEELRSALQSTMGTLPDAVRSYVNERVYPLSWDDLVAHSAFRNVAELCAMFGPFLRRYSLDPNLRLPTPLLEMMKATQRA